MGLGRWDPVRKRHLPITRYAGSWADTVNREPPPKPPDHRVRIVEALPNSGPTPEITRLDGPGDRG